MQMQKRSNLSFTSFFITALAIVAIVAIAIIAYRIESKLQVDPIIVFTLTDHMDGHFSYTIFNVKGQLDLTGLYAFVERINDFQAFIPAKAKGFAQLITAAIDIGYEQVQRFLS